jgi:hypothetical protein
MASPGELIKRISDVFCLPEVKVASYYRYLRQAGLVSKAGRGLHAARMTPKDSSLLLMACGGSRIERDNAVDSVGAYSKLRASSSAYIHHRSFGEFGIEQAPQGWVENHTGIWVFEGFSLPHLQALPERHDFTAALEALIEASMNREYSGSVSKTDWKLRFHTIDVFFYGPIPTAKIAVSLSGHKNGSQSFKWLEETTYLFPEQIEDNIAHTEKTRKAREALGVKYSSGDLTICRQFTQETIHAVADILLKT